MKKGHRGAIVGAITAAACLLACFTAALAPLLGAPFVGAVAQGIFVALLIALFASHAWRKADV